MGTGTKVAIGVGVAGAAALILYLALRSPEVAANTPAPPPSGPAVGSNAGDVMRDVMGLIGRGLDFANNERNRQAASSHNTPDSGSNAGGLASMFAGFSGNSGGAGSDGYSQAVSATQGEVGNPTAVRS